MDWKEQLSEIEKDFGFHKEKDWKPAIRLVEGLLTDYPDDVELHVRAIYILHNILVEEEYPGEEQDRMIYLLQQWFNKSKEKFSKNTEYLFFVGYILHIAEWYFGLEDTKLAVEFQKKATEKEPGNLLYKWAYHHSLEGDGDVVEGGVAHQIIVCDKDKVTWLKTKGFPGEYVLEHLEMSIQKWLDK